MKEALRTGTIVAVSLVLFLPLFVTNSLFFPFITGKAFAFRILVEIAFAGWLTLACIDKEYRPRFSWILAAFAGLTLWMFAADLFAVNVLKAFWSNFERMEGWITLIHLFAFFIVLTGTLRDAKAWRTFWLTSLVVSGLVCLYAVFQLMGAFAIHQGSTRVDATFGNAAYLGVYLLMSAFISAWRAWEDRGILRYTLVALTVLETVILFYTATRGAILGLTVGVITAAFFALFYMEKRGRTIAASTLAALLIVVGGFYAIRHTTFIQNNDILGRVASISPADGQVRFMIWTAALKGVAERPIVGWGQEGFNYVFNKYYDPALYKQEAWFDRAHDEFIDWMVAGGIPAFLLYVGMFLAAFLVLVRGTFRPEEKILFIGVLAGYAFNNLFVFDNLMSYVLFVAILALVHARVSRPISYFEKLPVMSGEVAPMLLAGVAAVGLVTIYIVNAPGISTNMKLLSTLQSSPAGVEGTLATYEDLAQNPSFAGQEIREQLVSYALQVTQAQNISNDVKSRAAALAVSEMGKQVAAYPSDAREHMELSLAYRASGDLAHALSELQAAETYAPNKEQVLVQLGIAYLDLNDAKSAAAYFNKAYALGPQFSDLAEYAAAGDMIVGDREAANQLLMKTFGTTIVDSDVLALAYYRIKDFDSLIAMWKLRTSGTNVPAANYFGLAGAYYAAGDTQKTIETLQTLAKVHPETANDVATAIQQVISGNVK